MRKLVVEGIGTFFLVLTVGQTALDANVGPLAPLAIGSVLMTMIYAGAHISGAHYNPAVSIAVWLRGKATAAEVLGYLVAQVIGAVLAAFVVTYLKDPLMVDPISTPLAPSIVAELLFTFALVWVVLNVATARGVEGNSYYGLAIGFTVMAGAYAVGGISGGVFNPAVGVGLLVFGVLDPARLGGYIVAHLIAGTVAAALFNALDLGNDKPTTATRAEQEALRPQAEP